MKGEVIFIIIKFKKITKIMKDLIELFFVFAKIGLFTFGGGYAMLPMLQKEIVEKHKWLKKMKLWIILQLDKLHLA